MDRFRGKVAFISGGGSGIGEALAVRLAELGALCAIADINAESADAVAARIRATGGRARGMRLDVVDPEGWRTCTARTESEFGPIDLLCSNAGVVGATQPLTKLPVEYLRWVLDVNLMGAVHAVQAIVPGMQARGSGHVLFTASMAGLSAVPKLADYCASKSALIALAESLRQEVAEDGVGVSLLCPASVATGLARSTRQAAPPGLEVEAAPDSPEVLALKARSIEQSGGTISAQDAARLALEGVERGAFFILTHPGSGARCLARADEIERALEALRGGAQPAA
jgi:NAD(P)-dependent dehydrogenase (short-subunit alcohol dehydrogenase family)